jgi:alpha-tubulin suppressor-like RCC1 family protein
VKAVAAADYTSFALKADGTVWAWGLTPPRDLGVAGATEDAAALAKDPTPIQVEGLMAIASISAIGNRMLALRGDGTVWSWGGSTSEAMPTQVPALDDAVAVAAGRLRHLVLQADGSVWTWGKAETPEPALVAGLGAMTAIAGGGPQSAAVAADGTVWIWGSASLGGAPKPPAQAEGLTDVVAIVMTYENAIVVLKADGTVWSRNIYTLVQPVAAPAAGTPVS